MTHRISWKSSGGISLLTEAAAETVDSILKGVPDLSEWESTVQEDGRLSVSIKTRKQDPHEVSRQLFFAFAESGETVLEMTAKRANLEDVFLELTEETDHSQCEVLDNTSNLTSNETHMDKGKEEVP